ncbi:MAG: cytochrome b/b6 domain-containing protein [Sulfurovaceae bacterium]|nr:cytochrome b/b6 domain-containing protein [Sulfurovaceae bacterium]
MIKSYIWPLGNRISHALMIVFFAAAYLLGDADELLKYHVIFGFAFGILVLFRIFWGFAGPKYSKFRDFDLNINSLKKYIGAVFSKGDKHIGHNPASSFAIITMFIVAILTILSGMLAYGVEENHGIFAFLHQANYQEMEIFEELHELFANLFLGVVFIHIAGSLMDKFIKKGDAVDSMIDGYKMTDTPVGISTSWWQKIFQIIWIAISIWFLYYLFATQENIFVSNYNKPVSYAVLHPEFEAECGSCHITYPPFLLPQKSWTAMMENLEDHFGDDASLDEATMVSILCFLEKNSAENSTHQAAFKITKSLKETNQTVIAITKTPYWKAKHKEIDSRVFLSNKVKSKANCQACHQDIEKGMLENNLIQLPKGLRT